MKKIFALFLAALLLFPVTASADNSDYLKWRKRFITLSSDELQSAANGSGHPHTLLLRPPDTRCPQIGWYS